MTLIEVYRLKLQIDEALCCWHRKLATVPKAQ